MCNPLGLLRVEMAKWPSRWRSRSITLIFNSSRQNPKMYTSCKFGDSSPNLLKFLCGQAKFPRVKMVKMTWRSRSMTPIFNTSQEYPSMFGANLVIPTQICGESVSTRETEFPRILSENDQNDLGRSRSMTPILNTSWEYDQYPMFGENVVIPAQICDELSCGQGKVYGWMYGRTDNWTDTGNDNTLLSWKAKG